MGFITIDYLVKEESLTAKEEMKDPVVNQTIKIIE